MKQRFRRQRQAGFSLIEATISTVVVGVMMAAALTAVGRTGLSRRMMIDQQIGDGLAQDLMAEILTASYMEPGLTSSTIGPGATELTGDRSLFDDVDDYDGWSASPPQWPDGTVISDRQRWRRSVEVVFARLDSPATTSSSDQGLKRITVTVEKDDRLVSSLVAIAGKER